MKEVLIVGENGFLGRELKKELITEKEFKVIGSSRDPESSYYLNLNESHNLSLERFDIVILLSGITDIQFCEKNKDLCYETNVRSTIRLMNEAVDKGCFVIFISSSRVFDGRQSFYSYDSEKNPITKYGKYKSIVEEWINSNYKNKAAILRLTKVLPSNVNPPFVDKWIHDVKSVGFATVYTNHFLSPILEVEAIEAIRIIINSEKGGLFQKGADTEISYEEYAQITFRNNPNILRKLKMIEFGDRLFFNSLKTHMPIS